MYNVIRKALRANTRSHLNGPQAIAHAPNLLSADRDNYCQSFHLASVFSRKPVNHERPLGIGWIYPRIRESPLPDRERTTAIGSVNWSWWWAALLPAWNWNCMVLTTSSTVIDHSGARLGEYEDVSKVERYQISQEAYDQRQDTVRSFMKRSKLGRYNEEERAQQEAEAAQRLMEEKALASSISVGSRCEVRAPGQSPRRGTVMYVV
ncbi:tubulin-folding cofactor B isoform X3 [Heterocephalus glaber]|uniref:Tubulin-folding cofactor B isoform X3 n=1 Tax=Heterocephalus glaber TaxID=10181 RepID=A0AAX6RFS5_HETGA|nr:tubulin-folding cofactor B isoform X3 [Heterocephalus glaber]